MLVIKELLTYGSSIYVFGRYLFEEEKEIFADIIRDMDEEKLADFPNLIDDGKTDILECI